MKFYEFKAISLRNATVWADKSPLNGYFSLAESIVIFQEYYKSEYKER
jgi:hypothetical protein